MACRATWLRNCAWPLVVAVITGCGGGGGSGSAPPASGGGGGSGGGPPAGANRLPVAVLASTATSGSAPLTVAFDGSGSSDPDGRIASYSWSFGDAGADAGGPQVSYTYGQPGSYVARLTVVDDRGGSDSAATTITVSEATVPDLSHSVWLNYPTFAWVTQEVFFYGYVWPDGDGTIVDFAWDFGDGSAEVHGVTARHRYSEPGDYQVSLRVTDDRGATGVGRNLIQIMSTSWPPSVHGSVFVPVGNARDLDVNRLPASGNNNDFDNAQPLDAPVVVGGYVNRPGEGPEGASKAAGDPRDIYRVVLKAGDRVVLELADAAGSDLDLYLYDDARGLVDASVDITTTEMVVAPADGAYFLEVAIVDGAGAYRLTIGAEVTVLEQPRLRLADAFVAGRAVRLPGSGAAAARAGGRASRSGRSERADRVALGEPRGRDAAALAALRRRAVMTPGQAAKLQTLVQIKSLRRAEGADAAEPEYLRKALRVPQDPLYAWQWNLREIAVPEAWSLGDQEGVPAGDGSIVAVIDTGILHNHPDLQGQWIAGYDFISDALRSADGDGLDADPEDPGDDDTMFHGTFVAGVIAARRDNRQGIAGVAPGARIMPLRVLGPGGGTSYDVAQAIRYAAGLANDSGQLPAARADIINLSLGGYVFSSVEASAVAAARAAGVILVAAAGNDATSELVYPASYPGVFSVAATIPKWGLARYSNYGPRIDLVAPGGDVDGDYDNDGLFDGIPGPDAERIGGHLEYGYSLAMGTSFSAPHMAGVLALMRSARPDLSEQTVRSWLTAGLLTTGSSFEHQYYFGYGLLNARKALRAALGFPGIDDQSPARMVPSVYAHDFGIFDYEMEIDIVRRGAGTLVIESVEVDAVWPEVHRRAVDSFGFGTYRVTVDRYAFPPGVYQASITFRAGDETLVIPIRMETPILDDTDRADDHFVVLIDADTGDIVSELLAWRGYGFGSYEFVHDSVPSGRYWLLASTDYDGDGVLCELGEACGIYPFVGAPLTVDVGVLNERRVFVSGHRWTLPEGWSERFPDGVRVTPQVITGP
jgi:serine protease